MNETELYAILSDITLTETPLVKINVAYDHFDEKTMPPFILYRNTNTTTLKADDKVYFQHNQYIIDLITEIKDTSLESKLENVLNNNNLPYDKQEDYLDDERIYQIRYFI